MSIKFNQVRTKLGLDDVLSFGRHQGYTVEEVIKDRPEYIAWLIAEGKQFYESVHDELALYKGSYRQPFKKPEFPFMEDPRPYFSLDDLFNDIPF